MFLSFHEFFFGVFIINQLHSKMMNKSDFERFIEKCEASDELLPNGCTILRDTEQDQLVLMKETATQRND